MDDAMQRRCVRAATLGLIALAAYFQASGISQLCADRLSRPSPLAAAATEQNASVVAADTVSPRPLVRLARSPATDGPASDWKDVALAACNGMGATLIASFPETTLWSQAAVTTKAGEKPRIVHIGEPVGAKTVRAIEWNRVVLAEGDASCEIETFRSRAVIRANDHWGADPVAAPADDITKAIRRTGTNEASIERSAVERVLANPFEFLKATRIVPEQKDGNVIGIRVFGVGPGSLLSALGFENGDRLENVNGFEVGTPEQMMTAYARLRALEHLTVRINRAGRTMNLDIDAR